MEFTRNNYDTVAAHLEKDMNSGLFAETLRASNNDAFQAGFFKSRAIVLQIAINQAFLDAKAALTGDRETMEHALLNLIDYLSLKTTLNKDIV